ncbi:hypothetical protein FQN51_003983 [Onygenales sp. PD_10]|nr:hypothetical protein FQN51_003983 [Onygenales sp. PD_10]
MTERTAREPSEEQRLGNHSTSRHGSLPSIQIRKSNFQVIKRQDAVHQEHRSRDQDRLTILSITPLPLGHSLAWALGAEVGTATMKNSAHEALFTVMDLIYS